MKTLFLQVILFFILINFGCVESNSQASKSADTIKTINTMNTVNWSILSSGNQCGVEVAKKVLVKTQAEFDILWKECFQNMPVGNEKPNIDFSKDWVVGVFLGTINKGGHNIAIEDLKETENGLKASLTHTKPGSNCLTTMSLEFPYVIVRVKQFRPDTIEYDIADKTVDCN